MAKVIVNDEYILNTQNMCLSCLDSDKYKLDPDGRNLYNFDFNKFTFELKGSDMKNQEGCDPVDLIKVARLLIDVFNKNVPCRENSISLTKLDEAIMWQNARTTDRVERKVEGSLSK
jgi:hypothetical protein